MYHVFLIFFQRAYEKSTKPSRVRALVSTISKASDPPTGTQCSVPGPGDRRLCHVFICKITVFIAGIYIHAFSVDIPVHRTALLMA